MGDNLNPSVKSKFGLRPLKLLDVPKFLRFLWDGKEKNALDARMLEYPKLKVIVTEEDGQARMFTPIHDVMMIDSVAFDPDADAEKRLLCASETIQNVITEARASGYAEIVYVVSDGRSDKFMEKHFGFTKLVVMRKVL